MVVTVLTATNWLIDWRGPSTERLADRLLDALDALLLGLLPRP